MSITLDEPQALVPTVSTLVEQAYEGAKAKGFHDDDDAVTIAHRLLLIIGEVNEAFEEHRSGHAPTEIYYTYDVVYNGVKFKALSEAQVIALTGVTPAAQGLTGKPEGIPVEIADTVIRLFDFAGTYGIDLESAVLEKMAFNGTREFKHGRSF